MQKSGLPPGRRQIIKKLIEEKNRSLTIDELVKFTGIPKAKIRQTLTTYDTTIVRVGKERFDTVERIYSGRIFRYTPQKNEIQKGLLFAEEDLHLFLTAARDYWSDITLIDNFNNQYLLKKHKARSKIPFSYYRGLAPWYKKVGFQDNDDILFTCLDFNQKKFKIVHQKQQDRDEFIIKVKNKKLADLVYSILSYTIPKYELDTFLIRKYLFVFPYNEPDPPDHLTKAIWNDKRFLISTRDKMLSWSGYPLNHDLEIGIKKYYYQNERGEYYPVCILSDEYGRYGFCDHCEQRLIWEKNTGWRHPVNEAEWSESYLTKEFFNLDKNIYKLN
ncbi:hypothetical protein M1523_02170 [Patescibacteria group bacterium]|nr:hypothetical protein [Patescibacteria group bacterium]MCL5091469.1 hypothetical protein [Patescibacteria group bacterium]